MMIKQKKWGLVVISSSIILISLMGFFIWGKSLNTFEEWTKYFSTGDVGYSSFEKSPITRRINDFGVLASGKFTKVDGSDAPALIYIDPTDNFSFTDIDLAGFNLNFTDIHEARPIVVNDEYKIVLGTSNAGDGGASIAFVILNSGERGFDNLEVEFTEQIEDARIRAVFVGDIDNDGEEEIVIGTRPKGILKYYKYIDNKWIGFDIDFLNETIHDILIMDMNRNGRNEIIATASPITTDGSPSEGNHTGRIISYELNQGSNTWKKETLWEYNKTFTNSLIGERGLFEHPRYMFATDIDGDGLKEMIVNVLGSQNIELFRWNGSSYSREIIEDKLDIHDSAITTGDIDNDGRDELLALTLPDHMLLLYNYSNKSWEREVLADDLLQDKDDMRRIISLYIFKAPSDSYGKILYAVDSQNTNSDLSFYYLEHVDGYWAKKYIGTIERLSHIWGIFPLSSNQNVFLPCEKITENAKRYSCYQNSALLSRQKGQEVEQLSKYALEFLHNRRHLIGHAIGRAQLIISDYNLEFDSIKCSNDCITGYWHGIAEEWGKHDPTHTKEYVDFLTSLCGSKQLTDADCSGHSIGHLYMSVNKDLQKNLDLCNISQNNNTLSSCILGAVHQHTIDGGDRDIFQICEKQHEENVKKSCYTSGSFVYPRWNGGISIEDRLELCREISPKIPTELNFCYDGIGDLLISTKETLPFKWCEGLSEGFQELCTKGLQTPNPPGHLDGCALEETLGCGF